MVFYISCFDCVTDLGPSLLDEVFSELGNYDTLKVCTLVL
jgi:hypothetical protein